MVYQNNPVSEAQQFFPLFNLMYILSGAYIWEYARSLHFDIRLVRGGEKRTIWIKYIYIICRAAALGYSIMLLINIVPPSGTLGIQGLDCETWARLQSLLAYLTLLLSSLLIGIRVVAIWNRNTRMIAIIAIALLAEFAFLIKITVQTTAVWDTSIDFCAITNLYVIDLIVVPICDCILLVSMTRLAGAAPREFLG